MVEEIRVWSPASAGGVSQISMVDRVILHDPHIGSRAVCLLGPVGDLP